MDRRPICKCSAYKFPHKIGGKCKGSEFTENYYVYDGSACKFCNCNSGGECQVAVGQESIKEAECYNEAVSNEDKYLNLGNYDEGMY